MRYLVRWNPFEVLKYLGENEPCDIPDGCDIVKDLPDNVFERMKVWQGDIDWETVLRLHENGDYLSIFRMHNENGWSDDYYCCEYMKKYVDYNVELYKAS